MRVAASTMEAAGSLVVLAWGLAAALGRPRWWRWWARRPSRDEGRATVVIGVGALVWSVGEGTPLLTGTVVQLGGVAVVLAGGALLALATTRADRADGPEDGAGPPTGRP